MAAWIDPFPKAELHLHIEGTLEPEMMLELARRNGVAIPYQSVGQVQEAYDFKDLQSFLDLYYQGAQVLQKKRDFYELTWAYLQKAAAENVRHVEIFFDPQTHTNRGVDFEAVITGISEALNDGKKKWGISHGLIMCFLRHLPEDQALKTWQTAKPFIDRLVAVGLDSGELNNPPSRFKKVFQMAQDSGLRVVAHAGEEGPADYIWQALRLLNVERIDHGVRCAEDPELVKYLAETKVPLTVCPLSNVKLRVFDSLKEHNLKDLLDAGLMVSLNSDDPAYFGGYLSENILQSQLALQLTRQEVIEMIKNGFRASFLPEDEKHSFCQQIDEMAARPST